MISSFLKLKEPFLPYDKKGEWSRYHLRSCSIKFLLNTSSPLTGTSRRCLPNNGFCLQHLSSKATFHTTFRGHLPADECPSLSAARCVLLFVITFAIFYHDTCAVFICQDTNTNSAICTFLFPYPQFGLTRITKSSIVNLQTQVNENRYVRSVRQIIWCAIVHVHEYPSLKIKYRQFVLNFDGLFLL